MREQEIHIGINEIRYINDYKITAVPIESGIKKITPSSVADHEAKHAVVAMMRGTWVRKATRIPGPGYLGLTELSRPDPIAAAGPHATGSHGTAHDVFIIGFMGHDVHSASSIARNIIENNIEKIEAVGSLIEEKQTVTGNEIQEAMNSVDRKEEKVKVIIKSQDGGEQQTEELASQKGVVVFRREWITTFDKSRDEELPLAA